MEKMYGVMELIAGFPNIGLNRKQFPEKPCCTSTSKLKFFVGDSCFIIGGI
jgi:hypothetical protein